MGSLSGRCLCGTITYDSDADPAMTIICHCDDCQRSSGAGFSVNVVIPRAELTINGEPSVFNTTGDDTGQQRDRMFCKDCGSQMFTALAEMDGMIIIKAGTLDDKSGVAPEMEIYTDSAQPWRRENDELGAFPRNLQT